MFVSPTPLRRARCFPAAVAATLLLLAAAGARAQEQGPQQGPPFPTPNQRLPYPRVHHDTRNTGRAVEEPYWGVTDGNRTFGDIPNARTFSADGWVFPREASDPNNPGSFPLRPSQDIDNGDPLRTSQNGFTVRTAPGVNSFSGSYLTAPARPREGGAGAPRFVWTPRIPDPNDPNASTDPNAVVRYKIYVWLPGPDADTTAEPNEIRITDARYTVFYVARNPLTGALVAQEPVELFVNQDVSQSGWYALQVQNDDGTFSDAPFFPFYNGVTVDGAAPRVELDTTTENADAATRVVVADAMQFRQQFDFARATPVITNRHGGRTLDSGGQPPLATLDYGYDAFTGEATPGADPSLVSTLFQGPESYVFGSAATRTSNRYENADGTPRPLFSQMQVLVARTDFIADPRDASGTATIQVGSVYALDWLTGAPIWRFPDLTYAPGGARNPTFALGNGRFAPLVPGIETVDRNGNGTIEADEVFLVGQNLVGWRSPSTAPGRGSTESGALSGSITFAPRVPVFGTLQERRPGVATNVAVTYGADAFKALAYFGSNNGVLYALDAYGNNDGTYVDPTAAPPAFGAFVPGSTNVLWTFDPVARASVSLDDSAGAFTPPWTVFTTYHRAPTQDRNAVNAPAPGTFTWTLTLPENGLYAVTVNIPAPVANEGRITDARYFVNGIQCQPVTQTTAGARRLVIAANGANFFALNAGAVQITLDNTTAGPLPSQFVVADAVTVTPLGGGVPAPAAYGASSPTLAYEQSSPAAPDVNEQRLFIGNENGVLYALNASANPYASAAVPAGTPPNLPFAKLPAWWLAARDGAIASSPAVSARPNGTPARRGVYFTTLGGHLFSVDWQGPVTKADHVTNLALYDGSAASAAVFNATGVRPRWTFPNRYTDIDSTDNATTDPPDFFPATTQRLAAASNLGPISSAPSLMDFLENPADVTSAVRSYVVLAANDDSTSSSPGSVYLLDPGGDRNSFLTNPTRIGNVYAAHPLDRFSAGVHLGNATPAWTHRFQYGQTPGPDALDPLDLQTINGTTTDPAQATPARRSRPTVYVGALGRLYAMDIDPATNLFVRWPAVGGAFPGPDFGTEPPTTVPPDDDDALDPPNPNLPAAQQQRPIVARLIELTETSSVDGLAITGGPLQVRGNRPSPTYNPNLLAVNQDIRDPETQGTTTFQYPVLYATTAGGFLYEVSTNIEGEDASSPTGGSDTRSALGWALTTDPQRANPEHVLVDAVQGPGGPSGPSVATNVVFEGLDPFTTAPGALPFRPRPLTTGDVHTGQTGFPLDHNGLFSDPTTSTGGLTRQSTLEIPNADADPAQNTNTRLGNRIVWVFSGGPDGVIYAFTPGAFGGGGGSGPGGRPVTRTQLFSTGDPKVDIFDQEDFLYYRDKARDGGEASRPNRDGRTNQSNDAGAATRVSRAAKGKNNFFEWGETVYIVAWDLNARGPVPTPGVNEFYAEGTSVTITVTDRRTGATVLQRQIAPEAETYPFDRDYMVPPRNPPAGVTPVPLGVAFLEYTLGPSTRESPQTPGSQLEVRVEQRLRIREVGPAGGPGVTRDVTVPLQTGQGANDAVILSRLRPNLSIANPLAIAAGVRDMNNVIANPSPSGGAQNPLGGGANAIGPFANDEAAKNSVVPSTTTAAPAGDGSTDPDKTIARYNQALTNGNVIERFDLRPYLNAPLSGGVPVRNRTYTNSLAGDPRYYVPIAASMGFVGHGSPGSTAGNLLVENRSRLAALTRVRAARVDLLWRWWPGRIPNADATDAAGGNPRSAPAGMSPTGIINPLPGFEDEENLFEAQPWKRAGTDVTTGGPAINVNGSEDYPDIPRSAIGVAGGGGDLSEGRASLPAPFVDSRTSVSVRVPRYQPANLVAVTSLTSTYVAPNPADFTGGTATLPVGSRGPVQLPRGIANRQLRSASDASLWLTPFGYTTRLFLYVDSNSDGQLNLAQNTAGTTGAGTQQSSGVDYRNPDIAAARGNYEEAYREFEVWMGVPVDLKLRAVESVVDLGSVAHGFGMQNGLLGYGQGSLPQGFVPAPLPTAYGQFFKTVTIQNTGNTNLWNLRANQRFLDVAGGTLVPRSLTMRSDLVNPGFGIASFGADPNLNDPLIGANAMVQIATSLDTNFDPVYAVEALFAPFAGRHTLHKPKPGAVNPSVLGLPDTPGQFPAGGVKPSVGVAVPLGTPVGTYTTPLAFFESHDADLNQPYQPFPLLSGGQMTPAGPLYGGRNDLHPGDPSQGAFRAILPAGSEGFLRPRRRLNAGADANALEYLPYTNPSLVLKVSVQEAPLTGQIPDVAAATPNSILTGTLPNVDMYPLLDAATGDRPASALTPAAFRSATTGSLHVYLARNATDAGENGAADAAPGRPYRLFRTSLLWDTTSRVWSADRRGAPLADYTDPSKMGRWFTEPAVISAPGDNADRSSNTSPFVLHDVVRNAGTGAVTGEAATLFWLNTLAPDAAGATPVQIIYYAPITNPSTGELGAATPFLDPNAGNPRNRPDPTVRRFAPRAVTARDPLTGANLNTIFVFYYGGVGGRWQLLYAPFRAQNGQPTGYAGREQALPIPGTLSSASDPDGVFRTVLDPTSGNEIPVIDLYYTGISRANQNTDIYMTRYRVNGSGTGAGLAPLMLTRVQAERLQAPDRDPIWHGKHIGWYRLFNNRALLPVIYVQRAGTTTPEPLQADTDAATDDVVRTQNAWQYDEATGLLFQTFERTVNGQRTRNIVYVDTSAGTVRFRGLGTPSGNDIVYADYTPQTYRITRDTTADLGATAFMDRTVLPAVTPQNGYAFSVVRRQSALPVDRQWVIWQKGAQPGRASTLYYNTRRVGVDLKAVTGGLAVNESLLLSAPNGAQGGNQAVAVDVQVNGATVPFDVDFKNGRVYVPSLYEGLPFRIAYTATGNPPASNRNGTVQGTFTWIDEQAAAQMVSMQRSVNEGQAAAFLDLFSGVQGANDPRLLDPTLQPGRLWLFWTSPRGRTYDIYWQTMAPYFESPSFSGLPQQ